MTVWWIGNVAYLAVIVPVVLVLLTRMLLAALALMRHARALADSAGSLAERLAGLEDLERTPELARRAGVELERHLMATDRPR